jgi:hypothetical protein
MNYFAHALPFLDSPYFAAGTAVPDWLMVADRSARVRSRQAETFVVDPDPATAEVAGGVLQHLRDDRHFHESRAFAETSLELSIQVRRQLGSDDSSFRPGFLGHLLVEVLLDAALLARHPQKLPNYYRALATIDAAVVQQAVNRMAARPTARLAPLIVMFRHERILYDYLEDDRLMVRLNQVMRRIRFEPLPDDFRALLPAARRLVTERCDELLAGTPT